MLEFHDVRNRKRCIDKKMLILCKDDIEQICGHSSYYNHAYLCFFSIMRLRYESLIYPSRISIKAAYQVILQNSAVWLTESSTYLHRTDMNNLAIGVTYDLSTTVWIQNYRYTILSHQELGIYFYFGATNFTKEQKSFVSIFDGPYLIHATYLNVFKTEKDSLTQTAGYRVTCGIHFPNPASAGQEARMVFNTYRYPEEIIHITDSIVNLTINTTAARKEQPLFYHRNIMVVTHNYHNFVELSVTSKASMSGASYNCEFGGFSLMESAQHPRKVLGPYCTQTGVEPLVNDVNTFVASRFFLFFVICSYSFNVHMNISLKESSCEGITNACDLFCRRRDPSFRGSTIHYNVGVVTQGILSALCRVTIILEKGCVVLQRIPIDSKKHSCYVGIHALNGHFSIEHEILHMFRYKKTHI